MRSVSARRKTGPFLNHIPKNSHDALCLLSCEALILQALNEFECVEVVVLELRRGGAEGAAKLENRSVTSSQLCECIVRSLHMLTLQG